MHKSLGIVLPAALFVAPLALAAPKPMPPTPAPAAATHVSSATLHKFASAYEDARQVRMEYMARAASAKTKDQKMALQQQATKEIKQHISRHMPVSQYVEVGKAINANPDLRKQVIAILKTDQKKSMSANPGGG